MKRSLGLGLVLCLLLTSQAAMACVGKSILLGTDGSARSRFVAQVIAILINERTGTTVEIRDLASGDAIHAQMTGGDVDIAVDYASKALKRAGKDVPKTADAAYEAAKAVELEKDNLVWLPPLGFSAPGDPTGVAAPVAQKHTLKKFPALPRLIARTQGILPEDVVAELSAKPNPAAAAREFLKAKKLI